MKKTLLLAALFTANTLHADIVYQDDFTDASISSVWNIDIGSAVTLDTTNDQLDYDHVAGTSRRFLNYNDGTFLSKTGYFKATISNFMDNPSVFIGFVEDSHGNNANYASTLVSGNGTYELFFNNTAGALPFNNGAGWTGTLPAGTGLWSINGGATSAALDVGANVDADFNMKGFGFANFGNSGVFPSSSFSIDSVTVADSLVDGGGGGNVPPVFLSDPITKTPAEQDEAYSGSIAGDALDGNGDTLNFAKDSGPAWLSVAPDGTLSGTPLIGDLGANSWTVSVSDGNGGSDTASLEITVLTPGGGNNDPVFDSATLTELPAVQGERYAGSIVADASDIDGDTLTFSIVSGPSWLTMTPNGRYSGTPGPGDLGVNNWTVSVSDGQGGSSTATLSIEVKSEAPTFTKSPNVIVIVSDDAGYADFSFMDGLSGEISEVPTPHMDALAARGVTFSRAYVAANCQPTRAAITTGAYQQRIGNESVGDNIFLISQGETPDNDLEGVYEGLPQEVDTVWDRMNTLGYTTGAIGKWHLGATEDLAPGVDPEYPAGRLGNRPQNQGINQFFGFWHGSRDYMAGAYSNNSSPTSPLQLRYIREALNDDNGNVSDVVKEYTDYYDKRNDPNPPPQYMTNILGDYAESFVEEHHDDEEPFFLYVAHPAPHKPWTNESPDFNDPRIIDMVSLYRRQVASMMITMDKEIGDLMAQLEDPNGDGDRSDSISENTMVIFINDNGGVAGRDPVADVNGTDNGKLQGFKGSSYDGGIRVPMILSGAGVDPSKRGTVYNDLVHGVDIVPTSIALAGGSITDPENIDGTNILPHINGTDPAVPHEVLVHKWRGSFAVMKGDYTLQNSRNISAQPQFYELYRLTNGDVDVDPGQTNDLIDNPANASLVAELKRHLTDHESFFDKPRYAILTNTLATEPLNVFDHHVFRPGLASNWSGGVDPSSGTGGTANWYKAGTVLEKYLFNTDCFPGAVLEFPVHTANYTANNDYRRKTGMEFMLNKIILSGDFAGGSNQAATIGGNELLFTDDLHGTGPEIALDATKSGAPDFTFNIDLDVIMYDPLTITGDGDAALNINGGVSEYEAGFYAPRGLVKDGTCTATLSAVNTYTGDTTVNAGTLSLAQKNTSNDSSAVRIASSGATLNLTFSGTDTVESLFIGGVQQAAGVYGSLASSAEHKIAQITGSGTLTITADPASGYNGWADENAPGQTAEQDHDFDHVQNGIEYFMGESGSGFTALPSPDGSGTVNWTMGPDYAGTYATNFVVESSSPGLDNFLPVDIGDVAIIPGTSVSYTMPTSAGSLFIRLRVNPD